MAGSKVVLRTAFNDEFRVGDIVITQQGTELPSRKAADEVLAAAKASRVQLFEVPADAPVRTDEGSGN